MLPLFPSNLDPYIIIHGALSLSSNVTNEEKEITNLEIQHAKYFEQFDKIASNIQPIGDTQSKKKRIVNDGDTASISDGDTASISSSDNEEDNSNVEANAEVTMNY